MADIDIADMKISSTSKMAEAYNCHFTHIG